MAALHVNMGLLLKERANSFLDKKTQFQRSFTVKRNKLEVTYIGKLSPFIEMMEKYGDVLIYRNPFALRMAKTLQSFGHSECNRVNPYVLADEFYSHDFSITTYMKVKIRNIQNVKKKKYSHRDNKFQF